MSRATTGCQTGLRGSRPGWCPAGDGTVNTDPTQRVGRFEPAAYSVRVPDTATAALDQQEPVPHTRLGRPLHVGRLAWYGGSLLVFVAVVTMVALSTWQYSRAKPHTEARQLAASKSAPAVAGARLLRGVTELTADLVGRRVTVVGRFAPDRQWLVARPNAAGRAGYLVVAAFAPTNRALARSMLVVRGWTPAARPPAEPVGRQLLTAWIAPPEAVSATLMDSLPAGRLPEIAPARVAGRLSAPVLDGYLGIAHPTAPLQPAAEPALPARGSWSLLNLGYALQWLLFAAGALIMWMLQVRDARRSPEPAQPSGADGDAAGSAERSQLPAEPSAAQRAGAPAS